MAVAKSQAASTRELKHRILTCLTKLGDRDTHSAAAAELESIAATLTPHTLPPFLSSISATDAADKSPVRKHCLRLISLLSQFHGNSLSPYLSKLLSAVVRRLRDPASAVRTACVAAAASVSSHITKPPFTSIAKPLVDALVTEQDQNAQIGAAMCLAAAIEASPDPEPLYLRKLLPRLEKLLKNDGFKAKPAVLTVVGSVIEAGAASTLQIVKNLVPCLVGFIGSENWAARKAAAEALVKLAAAERDMLTEFRDACLKTFEARKFDKVKVVRETMNQLVDAWKEIADVSDDASSPPQPQSSSKENASGGRYPPGSISPCTVTSGAPQPRKKSIPDNRKRDPVDIDDKKSGPAMFRKLDCKKPTDQKIEISAPRVPSGTVVCEYGDARGRDETGLEKGEKLRSKVVRPGTRRALFNKNAYGMILHFDGIKAGSRIVPCHGDDSESTVAASNIAEDICKNQKESEDLTLIRKHLVQIEKQQSSLADVLQKFIGSSENGMRSLETRVQGLELAMDEISYDLAVTTQRLSNIDSKRTTCCKLPSAGFFNPKFWRRTEPQHSTSQLSSSRATLPMAAICNITDKNCNAEKSESGNRRRFQFPNSGRFIVNPLAEIHIDSHGISEVSSNQVSMNDQNAL
ncbi:Microtubule-associated protein [Actinidia chinensis var. chinensis]|uniref:Microtubule-associated protein n=1 Tax=Actinidia chinensis var. chinensis TaxID=1590841 RepID=A0A2R6QGV3_ACTCC|nr:Microtubule-associated protein [Actinidia chinensis var. chinensis]